MKFPRVITTIILTAASVMRLHAADIDSEALAFIQNVKERVPESVLVGSAISPYTTDVQRKKIERSLRNLQNSIQDSGGEIKIVESWPADPLGAVILSIGDPMIPESIRIIPLSMVKRDERWRVGPWQGSFKNTNLGFHEQTRMQARELELWMSSRSTDLLEELRDKAKQAFFQRVKMEDEYAQENIRKPEQVFERFLERCRLRDIPAAAYYLEPNLLKENELSAEFVRNVLPRFRSSELNDGWKFLLEPQCVVLPILPDEENEEEDSLFTLALFDSDADEDVLFHWVEIVKNYKPVDKKTKWDLHLSEAFLEKDMERFISLQIDDDEKAIAFLEKMQEIYPAKPSETLDALQKSLVELADTDDFYEYLKLWKNYDSLDDFQTLRTRWKSLNKLMVKHIESVEQDDLAAFVLSKDAVLAAQKSANGWFLVSDWSVGQNIGLFHKDRLKQVTLRKKIKALQSGLDMERVDGSYPPLLAFEKKAKLDLVDDELAEELVLTWQKSLSSGEYDGVDEMPAAAAGLFPDRKFTRVTSARERAGEFLSAHHEFTLSEGDWSLVAVSVSRMGANSADVYFYFVTEVNGEPKILADVDLEMPKNRGRILLNQIEFQDLEGVLEKKSVRLLKSLYDKGVAEMKKVGQEENNGVE